MFLNITRNSIFHQQCKSIYSAISFLHLRLFSQFNIDDFMPMPNDDKEMLIKPLPNFKSHANSNTTVPIFKKTSIYSERIALKDEHGKYSYNSLAHGTKSIAKLITDALNGQTNEKIVFLCPNDGYYVLVQWAIWASGNVAVPLSPLHPSEMIQYYVKDCKANLLISTPKFAELMDQVAQKTKTKLIIVDDSIRRQSMFNSEELSYKFNFSGDNEKDLGQPTEFYQDKNALIIYTSGTTGNPKGVVLSHKNLQTQILALIKAWKWNPEDCILHTLPLHHIHGIVNVLMCPLYVGAKCIMLPKFDARNVWSHLLGINLRPEDRINIYMAVPTIYTKLIQEYEEIFKPNPKMVDYVLNTLKSKIRLMVSGSASLPVPIFNKWLEISGHKLLERYGMSETGMSLSNFYSRNICDVCYLLPDTSTAQKSADVEQVEEEEEEIKQFASQTASLPNEQMIEPCIREPGYVGLPLPGVSIRLAEKLHLNKYRTILEVSGGTFEEPKVMFTYFDEKTSSLIQESLKSSIDEESTEETITEENYPTGEILVKGNTVFIQYFNKLIETQMEFTEDGWFKTGDTALYDPKKKLFKILGRTSVDIIKSGGYKISALHIETILLEHKDIQEAAVVALPDKLYGQKVAAILVLKDPNSRLPPGLREWMKLKLADYAIPRIIRCVEHLPRNAMGKINKKQLVEEIFGDFLKMMND